MDNIELKEEILKQIEDASLPHYKDIPDIGLYLNQVAKYINEYLKPLGDLGITESMISNYVKQGIIDSPNKKLYYRDQIAYLFFIAIAKSILSLDNVRYLIEQQKDKVSLEEAYNSFADKFLVSLRNVFGFYEENENILQKDLLDKIIINITHKIYLDYYFEALTDKDE